MDFDFDDLISSDAAKTAKAGIKFQPKGKPKPKPNVQPEPKSTTPITQVVEVAASTEEQTGNDVNKIIRNIVDSLQSSFEKSQEENAESILTLDSPNDVLPESTSTVNLPPCSQTPALDVSMDGKLEAGPTEPESISSIDASTNLESIEALDPLTGEEDAILNDNEDFQIGNSSSGPKEAEDSLFWEPNILTQSVTGSGQRVSKFKPKPKAQSRKLEQIANNPDQDVRSVQHGENIHSVSLQTDFNENEPVPSFTMYEILGTSSIGTTDSVPTETISDYHENEESISLTELSQMDSMNEAGRSSNRPARPTIKPLQIIDEAENEGIDANDNNDDFVEENESSVDRNESKSKSKSKSKKPVVDKNKKPVVDKNKKPVRKRKKDREVADEVIEVPKKKFSHSTKRNKRPVNPELLNIPEEEFELHMHNFPLRDLIRLREHKERIEKKEASSLGTDATDESDLTQNATYYNYQTHMKITPRMKWTKQETELFYEAIQQFGTDLSIITECFPGRTRTQIRSKFKKEYKQNRLRIESALNTRSKGHSYFDFVIERLKQAQAEEDSENDDPVTFTGEEDEVQVDGDNNEGELQKEVKDMEAGESPTKANDIEEDDTWSQYKSEI